MGYHVVDTMERDPTDEPERESTCRRLTEPAGLSRMAINRYRADPGEMVPLKYHAHETQEEAFYVLSGTLYVETPDETFEVPEGSLFAADPGSPHRAYNPEDATDPVSVLAIGAPQTKGDAYAYDPESSGADD